MNDPLQSLFDTSRSAVMQPIVKAVSRLATSDLGILLVGEFGTGKEWLAHKIHQIGPRAKSVFLSVDCRTVPPESCDSEFFGHEEASSGESSSEEGILEEADGGTLFLDGFTRLPLDFQMKLARLIAHRKFHRPGRSKEVWLNARVIIAATERPSMNTLEGRSQQEALSRMSPMVFDVPPLRNRRDDLLDLLNLFIAQTNDRIGSSVRGISPDALRLCLLYPWPGNIRELRNTVEYAAIMARGHLIQPVHLPLQVRAAGSLEHTKKVFQRQRSVTAMEKFLIMEALRKGGTKKDAAKILGITLRVLQNKLEYYSLAPLTVSGGEKSKETLTE